MDGQNFLVPELHIPEDPNFKDKYGLLAFLGTNEAYENGSPELLYNEVYGFLDSLDSQQDEEVCINNECSSVFWKLPDKKLNVDRKIKRNNTQEKTCVKIPPLSFRNQFLHWNCTPSAPSLHKNGFLS